MSDITGAGAKAKRGKRAVNDEGDASVEGQVGRMLVRAIWAQEWSAANPEGKPEQRKAAWKGARAGVTEKNLKVYRRALGALKRSGVVLSLTPMAAAADADDMGDDA